MPTAGSNTRSKKFRFQVLNYPQATERTYRKIKRQCEIFHPCGKGSAGKAIVMKRMKDGSLLLEWPTVVYRTNALHFIRNRCAVRIPFVLTASIGPDRVNTGLDKEGKMICKSWVEHLKGARQRQRLLQMKQELTESSLRGVKIEKQDPEDEFFKDEKDDEDHTEEKVEKEDLDKVLAVEGDKALSLEDPPLPIQVIQDGASPPAKRHHKDKAQELAKRQKTSGASASSTSGILNSSAALKPVKIKCEPNSSKSSVIAAKPSSLMEPDLSLMVQLRMTHKLVQQKNRSDSELKQSLFANFKFMDELSRGVFGSVHVASCQRRGNVVIKMITGEDYWENVIAQTGTQLSINGHPNIIHLLSVSCSSINAAMILEHGGQSLRMRLARCRLPPQIARSTARQILAGLAHMHRRKIIHNDVTPANICLDSYDHVRLINFSRSIVDEVGFRPLKKKSVNIPADVEPSKLWYRAVEVLCGQVDYTISSDLWSVGCIVAEMNDGAILFEEQDVKGMVFSIFNKLGSPVDKHSFFQELPRWNDSLADVEGTYMPGKVLEERERDFLFRLLRIMPHKRPTAQEALDSPYFQVDTLNVVVKKENESAA